MSTKDRLSSIQVHQSTKDKIKALCHGRTETYEDVIKRFLHGDIEIYVDIKSVDGEPPIDHRVIMQIGNKWFHYDYGVIKPLLRRTLT